ncbi:MAG: hypothetical protein V7K47_11370 [Nostoc sp.]
MDSQILQPTIIDTQTLEKLEAEIQQEMCEILKNANFHNILEKYGISQEKNLQLECSLDLTQIIISGTEHSLIKPSKRTFLSGCWCPCRGVCPCSSSC